MGLFDYLIAPILGVIANTVMFFAPLPAVLQVRALGEIRQLNPLPYPVIVANCVGWLIYSDIIRDPFIFAGNIIGVVLSIFYTFTTIGYASTRIRDWMMLMFITFPLVYLVQVFIYAMMKADSELIRIGMGVTCNVMVVIYYAAPLSVFYKVIVARNCSSLSLPLAITNLLNGSMWFVYGWMALHDPYVWVCNGVGSLLSVFALILMIIYPRYSQREECLFRISSRVNSFVLPHNTEYAQKGTDQNYDASEYNENASTSRDIELETVSSSEQDQEGNTVDEV
eukprot:TRINITY_DN487_c1_g1_i1.p1 TRINITY_DN487_c1_g1~~TRINITY_DN487_c1_g1_i1.p1  ORF type:complete len:282 (-),score=6.68 TRINITY_DN487_c1_g1_i1:1299-2144(-)